MQYHGSSNGIDGRLEVYKAFAPTYPVVQAWGRMALATIIMFAMPATCLRHLKTWSWPASIVLLATCCAATVLLIAPMLPHTTRISYLYNIPPTAGLMKDMSIIWVFTWVIAADMFNVTATLQHWKNK